MTVRSASTSSACTNPITSARGPGNSFVQGVVNSIIRLAKIGRNSVSIIFNDLGSPVRRHAVDYHILDIPGARLLNHAFDCRANRLAVIENGGDD